jgi:hypothetical protein
MRWLVSHRHSLDSVRHGHFALIASESDRSVWHHAQRTRVFTANIFKEHGNDFAHALDWDGAVTQPLIGALVSLRAVRVVSQTLELNGVALDDAAQVRNTQDGA